MDQHAFDESELEPSLRGHDSEPAHGHDRLAALAQHIVEASGSEEHGALSMEQTLDQQEQQQAVAAVDLLSFANESGPSFSENFHLEGLLGQQQQQEAQARQALDHAAEESNREFGSGGYNMDESLNGAYNYHQQEVGEHSQHQGSEVGVDKPMIEAEIQSDGGHMSKRRKRKPIAGEDAVKHKKEKEVERRRRAMINEGIDGIVALLPQADKQKGAILQQAAQYIRDLQIELRQKTEEVALGGLRYEAEIKELQNALASAETKYTNEHNHAQRLENSWRDAEVKVSAMRMELDALRAKHGQ